MAIVINKFFKNIGTTLGNCIIAILKFYWSIQTASVRVNFEHNKACTFIWRFAVAMIPLYIVWKLFVLFIELWQPVVDYLNHVIWGI